MKLLALTACLLLLGCSRGEKPKEGGSGDPPPPPQVCIYDEEPNDDILTATYMGGFVFVPQSFCGELEWHTDTDTYWFGVQEPLLANFDIVADAPFQMFVITHDEKGEPVYTPFFSSMAGDLVILQWLIEPDINGFYIMLSPLDGPTDYEVEYWES
jgi:hypothetical protein